VFQNSDSGKETFLLIFTINKVNLLQLEMKAPPGGRPQRVPCTLGSITNMGNIMNIETSVDKHFITIFSLCVGEHGDVVVSVDDIAATKCMDSIYGVLSEFFTPYVATHTHTWTTWRAKPSVFRELVWKLYFLEASLETFIFPKKFIFPWENGVPKLALRK
ncbi:hypothetical protein ACJX0J_008099, partial [Zea mays]